MKDIEQQKDVKNALLWTNLVIGLYYIHLFAQSAYTN